MLLTSTKSTKKRTSSSILHIHPTTDQASKHGAVLLALSSISTVVELDNVDGDAGGDGGRAGGSLTLFSAASTLSGMWSCTITGEMSTSSKAVLSAQMAW